MPRPYRIRVSIENADKGKTDRTELHFPTMNGETSKAVADAITTLLNAQPTAPPTPVAEHERLVAAQAGHEVFSGKTEPTDAGTHPN